MGWVLGVVTSLVDGLSRRGLWFVCFGIGLCGVATPLNAQPTDPDAIGELTAAQAFSLGQRFENGDGVGRDEARAFGLYCEAAQKGHTAAAYNLGWLYLNGRGVARSDGRAGYWLQRASARGDFQAQGLLQRLHLEAVKADPSCPLPIGPERPSKPSRALARAAAPVAAHTAPAQASDKVPDKAEDKASVGDDAPAQTVRLKSKPAVAAAKKSRARPSAVSKREAAPVVSAQAGRRDKPTVLARAKPKAAKAQAAIASSSADSIQPCRLQRPKTRPVAVANPLGSHCVMVRSTRVHSFDRLIAKAEVAGVKTQRVSKPFGRVFQLYEAGNGSLAAARQRLRQLRAQGLRDVALISSGPLLGAVSFGAYQNPQSVGIRRAALSKQGVELSCREVALQRPKPALLLLADAEALQAFVDSVPGVRAVVEACR